MDDIIEALVHNLEVDYEVNINRDNTPLGNAYLALAKILEQDEALQARVLNYRAGMMGGVRDSTA